MKKFLLLAGLVVMNFQTISSAFAGEIFYYLNTKTSKFIDIYNVNEQAGTATYYDYEDSKKKQVLLSDLSKETRGEINGIKGGMIALLKDNDYKACEVFHLFENGQAYIGCRTDKMAFNLGVDRNKQVRGIVNSEELIGEVKSLEGVNKKDKMVLLKDSGTIKAGTKVRVEAILQNGEAIIQKAGLNLLDTSNIILLKNIEKVSISDLGQK